MPGTISPRDRHTAGERDASGMRRRPRVRPRRDVITAALGYIWLRRQAYRNKRAFGSCILFIFFPSREKCGPTNRRSISQIKTDVMTMMCVCLHYACSTIHGLVLCMDDGRFSLSTQFVKFDYLIVNPISFFNNAIHSWVQVKAYRWRRCSGDKIWSHGRILPPLDVGFWNCHSQVGWLLTGLLE